MASSFKFQKRSAGSLPLTPFPNRGCVRRLPERKHRFDPPAQYFTCHGRNVGMRQMLEYGITFVNVSIRCDDRVLHTFFGDRAFHFA